MIQWSYETTDSTANTIAISTTTDEIVEDDYSDVDYDDGVDEDEPESKGCDCPVCKGKADSVSSEADTARNVWKLPLAAALPQIAADFYLLYDLYLDEHDEGAFDELVQEWIGHFAAYTNMIIGGELRYATRYISQNLQGGENPVKQALAFNGALNISARGSAWGHWATLYKEHGTNVLTWAAEIYRIDGWRAGYGGEAWAKIADALLLYESGRASPVMFIDMCWGLQHNSGQFFSKLWDVSDLSRVLEANLAGNMDYLYRRASSSVRALWNRRLDVDNQAQ